MSEIGKAGKSGNWPVPLLVIGAVIFVAIVVTLGLSLAGQRAFHGSDILEGVSPWRNVPPDDVIATNPLVGDTVDALMPARAQFTYRMSQGDVAMWLPNVLGGKPLAAVPSGSFFSPISLPYWVLPLWYAVGIVKLVELAVSIGFTYLFARRIGLGKAAGLVGGLVFAFSGFQVVWNNWPQTHVGALIAALFWSIEVAVSSRRFVMKLPLVFVVAAMWLVGFPSVTGYALLFGGVYALVRSGALSPMMERIRAIAMLAVAVVLGTAIVAVQLLPFAESLSALDLSGRVQSSGIHLPLRTLATFVVPNAFGSPVDRNYYGPMNYIEIQSFVGVVAVVLVVLAAVYGRRFVRTSILWYFLIASAAALILLYLGGPLLGLLQNTPVFGMNFVGRLRSVQGFLLAVLAAIGYEALSLALPSRANWRSRVGSAALVLIVTSVLGLALYRAWQMAASHLEEAYLYRNTAFAVFVLLLAIGTVAAGHSSRRWAGRIPLVVLPILIGIEVARFAMPFWPQIPREEFYPVTPSHEFFAANLGEDRIVAAGVAMYPGTTTFYGLRSVTGHAFHDPAWQDLLEAVDPAVMDASPTFSILASRPGIGSSPIFDRLGAKYFVADPRVRLAGTRITGTPIAMTSASAVSFDAVIPVDGAPRGIVLFLDDGFDPGENADLFTLELVDSDGAVLASGFRRAAKYIYPGLLEIPLTETGDGSPTHIRLSYRGDTEVDVRVDDRGRLEYEVAMVEDDGLAIVHAGETVIYERLNALPRIRWARSAIVYATPAERIAALSDGVPADTVVLSNGDHTNSDGEATITLVRDGGDELEVDVDAEGDGYLVVADTMQRDWVATVDNRTVPILAADHAIAAIAVSSGQHRVLLRYVPSGQATGALITLVALLVCLGVAVHAGWRWRSRHPNDRHEVG